MNVTMAMTMVAAVATKAFCSIILLFLKNYELHECTNELLLGLYDSFMTLVQFA